MPSDILVPMHFKPKKISLLILAITALACSRIFFSLFNDPEGLNLLIVVVMAIVLYFSSLTAYVVRYSITGLKRLLLAVSIQVLLVIILYFCLN